MYEESQREPPCESKDYRRCERFDSDTFEDHL